MNKSVFSLLRRLSTWRCPHLLLSAVLRRRCCWAPALAVDRYLLPAGRSAANPLHVAAAVERQDRQTDARPLHRNCPRDFEMFHKRGYAQLFNENSPPLAQFTDKAIFCCLQRGCCSPAYQHLAKIRCTHSSVWIVTAQVLCRPTTAFVQPSVSAAIRRSHRYAKLGWLNRYSILHALNAKTGSLIANKNCWLINRTQIIAK